MRTFAVGFFALILVGTAPADELILKDGKTIDWRILKDNGDTIEVQTVDNKTLIIAKKDVKEIRTTVPKTPLTGATFTGDITKASAAPVNVLASVDPKKHGTVGEWRFTSGALVCTGGGGLCDLPYIPAGSYDVEITIERRDGDDECHIGLVAAGKPFSVHIDWGKGSCSGLSAIDGKRVYENETKVDGKQLTNRKPRTFICAVRPDRIVVLVDGKELINWKGDPQKLSLPSRPEKSQNLFFSVHQSAYAVTKFVVTPRKSSE